MAKKTISDRVTECSDCQAPVIHVRDTFTGATFPVDAEPYEGMALSPPGPRERNPRAERGVVYVPHHTTCSAQLALEEAEEHHGEG